MAKGIKVDSSLDRLSLYPIEVELLNLDRDIYLKDLTSFGLEYIRASILHYTTYHLLYHSGEQQYTLNIGDLI